MNLGIISRSDINSKLNPPGPILDNGGMGAFFGGTFFEKRAFAACTP